MALQGNQKMIAHKDQRAQDDALYEGMKQSRLPAPMAGNPATADWQGALSGPAPAPVDGNNVQRLVQNMAVGQHGWSGSEWDALYDLIQRESGWDPYANNPSSSAAGLFQFMDDTRANYGITENSPLDQQFQAGLQYIADRYGTPSAALDHWLRRVPINGEDVGHWY